MEVIVQFLTQFKVFSFCFSVSQPCFAALILSTARASFIHTFNLLLHAATLKLQCTFALFVFVLKKVLSVIMVYCYFFMLLLISYRDLRGAS